MRRQYLLTLTRQQRLASMTKQNVRRQQQPHFFLPASEVIRNTNNDFHGTNAIIANNKSRFFSTDSDYVNVSSGSSSGGGDSGISMPSGGSSSGASGGDSSSGDGGSSDRIHSTDIAFKPAKSGWGAGSKKYMANYDNIFNKKNQNQNNNDDDNDKDKK